MDVNHLLGVYPAYREARKRLLDFLGCPQSNRDPLAEFSEQLVASLVDGKLADSRVQKDYDILGPGGSRIQVRYVTNPIIGEGPWVNEHVVDFRRPDLDKYALVIIEDLVAVAVLIFSRETLADVCRQIGKRHGDQAVTLQLTRRNVETILAEPGDFEKRGVEVIRLPGNDVASQG